MPLALGHYIYCWSFLSIYNCKIEKDQINDSNLKGSNLDQIIVTLFRNRSITIFWTIFFFHLLAEFELVHTAESRRLNKYKTKRPNYWADGQINQKPNGQIWPDGQILIYYSSSSSSIRFYFTQILSINTYNNTSSNTG